MQILVERVRSSQCCRLHSEALTFFLFLSAVIKVFLSFCVHDLMNFVFCFSSFAGSCRAGFACALEHIGVPLTESGIIALEEQEAAAAAAADNNNNNNDVVVEVNQQLQAQIQLPKPSASWAAPQKKKSVPTQMNPEHVRASEEAVAGVVNILDVKKVSEK